MPLAGLRDAAPLDLSGKCNFSSMRCRGQCVAGSDRGRTGAAPGLTCSAPPRAMVKKFFKRCEWELLAPIEQTRAHNVYKNYKTMLKLGMETKPPDFVQRFIVRHRRRNLRRQRRKLKGNKSVKQKARKTPTKGNRASKRIIEQSSNYHSASSASSSHTMEEKSSPQILESLVSRKDEGITARLLNGKNGMCGETCNCVMEDQNIIVKGPCDADECEADPSIEVKCCQDVVISEQNFTTCACRAENDLSFSDCRMEDNHDKLDCAASSIAASRCVADSKMIKDSEVENSLSVLNSIESFTKAPFKCYVCACSILKEWNSNAHLKICMDEKHLECETCGQKFSGFGALCNHFSCAAAV
ncbi:uncharacterized protein [Procambarus clarkii]|uniref:uncharacterized protein n=1 Tax=Procambarus clarkii TaxID=6728 RepID=UPI001E670E6A|nr:uncharacterized protein LOC123772493 [Procambarus clarkii]